MAEVGSCYARKTCVMESIAEETSPVTSVDGLQSSFPVTPASVAATVNH